MQRLIILPFLLVSMIVSGTNYYVKNGGNDSNTGLSDAQAWAHHPWMSTWTGSVTLSADDNVYMKCGDTWSISSPSTDYMTVGQSGRPGNYITTTSYGSGSRPIINISTNSNCSVIYAYNKSYIIFDNLEITHYSSVFSGGLKHGIYAKSGGGLTNHDWIITNCVIHNIPASAIYFCGNAYNITIGDINATSCATADNYSNHIYDFGVAGIDMMGGNSATGRSDYKIYFNYIHDATRNDVNEYGIAFGANSDLSTMWPSYVWVKYNRVENIDKWEAVGTHGGSYHYYQDNYIKNANTNIVAFPATQITPQELDHIWIERNILENSGSYSGESFIKVRSTSFIPTDIYVRDNIIFFTSRPSSESHSGIKFASVDGCEISGNIIYNGPTVLTTSAAPIYFYNPSSVSVKNVTIKKNYVKDWSPVTLDGNGIVGIVSLEYNIFNSGTTPGLALYIPSKLTSTADLRIYNNVLLSTSTSEYTIQMTAGSDSGAKITVKNNIFGKTSSARFSYIGLTKHSGTISWDYNLYWNSTASSPFNGYSLSGWKGLGYDAHTPNTSNSLIPQFINASGSYSEDTDFKISTSSPGVSAGISVGLTTDYAGTAISGLPDIGAFESGTGSSISPAPLLVSSVIENSAPSVIKMTYNLTLANIVPAVSAFSVKVNSVTRNVSAVAISGTKVLLTLASPVVYGNNVTVAYTKPATNPLQTPSGGQAASISAQTVSNNVNPPVAVVNAPPNVVVNFRPNTYSGFVGTLNATGSYDTNKDQLTFTWKVPANIPVSATNGPILEFLAPVVDANKKIEFTLMVSDGKVTQTKSIPVIIIPYQPELEAAKVISVKASGFQPPYYPYNIMDGNIGTMWSAIGSEQWIMLELSSPFSIQHVKLAFQPGQRKESYFDIYGSTDTINWEPILIKSASCSFSGDLQVFDFPASKAEIEFKYVKLVGQGNSVDSWNYISELKIFGFKHWDPSNYDEQPVKLFPNPAYEFVNIRIDDINLNPDFIKIINFSGKVVFQDNVDPDIRDFKIQLNLLDGVYIVQIGSGYLTLSTLKLVVYD